MATFKFAPNVPAVVELGYIDIVPSEKGGPQVRFNGTIDGQEKTFAYLPGKLAEHLATLIAAGIIANKEYPAAVDSPLEVKPLRKQFTMMKEQLAGDKYGAFKIVNGNGGTSAASASAGGSVGSAAAPAGAHPKSYADIYSKATDFIIEKILPKYNNAKMQGLISDLPTANDVHAMVSTLFIPKSKEGPRA